jgi:hypothetical protein
MVSKTVFQTGLLEPYQDPPCSREAQDPPNLLRIFANAAGYDPLEMR